MIEILTLPFMQRAFIAGISLGALLACMGMFVVARRISFFGDGIAHASLAGVAIGIVAGLNPFLTALLTGVIVAIGIYILERKTRIASDALIGLIFTTSLALGVVLLSLRSGYQPELISFLFGNILTLTRIDVLLITLFSVSIISILAMTFKQFALVVFDRTTAWLRGLPVKTFEFLFYVILAIAVVLGVKLLGIILVSALLIIPPTAAKLVARSLTSLIVISVVLAEVAVISGLTLSYYLDLPSGATIILVSALLFFVILIAQKVLSLKER